MHAYILKTERAFQRSIISIQTHKSALFPDTILTTLHAKDCLLQNIDLTLKRLTQCGLVMVCGVTCLCQHHTRYCVVATWHIVNYTIESKIDGDFVEATMSLMTKCHWQCLPADWHQLCSGIMVSTHLPLDKTLSFWQTTISNVFLLSKWDNSNSNFTEICSQKPSWQYLSSWFR